MSSAAASEPVQEPSQPSVHWILGTLFTEEGRSADDHSRFSGARVKYTLLETLPSILRYIARGWCVS